MKGLECDKIRLGDYGDTVDSLVLEQKEIGQNGPEL